MFQNHENEIQYKEQKNVIHRAKELAVDNLFTECAVAATFYRPLET